jgi:hypothetical protein
MDLDAALKLEPGQVIWFQPKGDPLETAGPCLVIKKPALYDDIPWREQGTQTVPMLRWVEVEVLTPTTVLVTRDEELFFQEIS